MAQEKDHEPRPGSNEQSGEGKNKNDDSRRGDQMEAAHIVETTRVSLKNASQQLGYENEEQLFS